MGVYSSLFTIKKGGTMALFPGRLGVRQVRKKKTVAPKKKKRVGEASGDVTREKYVALCGRQRFAEAERELHREIVAINRDIENYQHSLVEALRDLEAKREELAHINSSSTKRGRFAAEFDQLLTHPDIDRLEVRGKRIVVHTKPIQIEHGRSVYDIGRFEITISTDGSDHGVKMVNKTRRLDGAIDHPHVRCGFPCLGNIQETVPHLIAEYQYAALISLCIQYLKSYEDSGGHRPYRQITDWPLVRGGSQ